MQVRVLSAPPSSSGCNSAVERQPSKLDVVGSNPIARSTYTDLYVQSRKVLGKCGGVRVSAVSFRPGSLTDRQLRPKEFHAGSNPVRGTICQTTRPATEERKDPPPVA